MKYTEEKWLDNFFLVSQQQITKTNMDVSIHAESETFTVAKEIAFACIHILTCIFFLCVFTSTNVLYTHTFINKRAMNGSCDRNRVILKKENKNREINTRINNQRDSERAKEREGEIRNNTQGKMVQYCEMQRPPLYISIIEPNKSNGHAVEMS